jgi:HK97 family phage major capsid protein
MNKIEQLRSQYAEIVAKMRGILDKADEEKRDLTEEETRSYEQFEADSEKIKAQVAREERLSVAELEMRRRIDDPLRPPVTNAPPDKKEFKSLGEFLYAVRFTPTDPRLMELREQQMVVGESGGFAVPPAFIPTLLQVTPQDAIWRPRCTVIPAGDSPDTDLTMPALDQGTGSNMYGGVAVYATSEGATLTETDAKIREVKLQPHETGAFVTVTDKLLRNWSACSSLIQTLLRRALIAWEDTKILTGTGVSEPTGIINSPCKIAYTRATASQIAFTDIIGMYARMKFGGSPIWVASQTTLPQILVLQDASTRYIFQPDARENVAGRLLGMPLLLADRAPALGSEGDIGLYDPAYYLLKDGAGISIALSSDFLFTSNKTVFKCLFSVDGKSWLNAPIPLEGSSSNTISPFVTLK